MPRFKAIVEIELDADNEGAVDDLIHQVWESGDPEDATKAMVWTKEIDPLSEEQPCR